MLRNKRTHHRRSIRLKGHNYTRPNAYFITICAVNHVSIFGDVSNEIMKLNRFGRIVHLAWFRLSKTNPHIQLDPDSFVVMPDHIHGIIEIVNQTWARHDTGHTARQYRDQNALINSAAVPLPIVTDAVQWPIDCGSCIEQFGKPVPGSIPTIIRAFKSMTTRRINFERGTPGADVWQRNCYERIIRTVADLDHVRRYIQNNPIVW